MRTSTSELAVRLKQRAAAEGFSACGICAPDAIPEAAGRLAAFVAAGWHGRMRWMAERMGWRGSPAALWPEARSVVMLWRRLRSSQAAVASTAQTPACQNSAIVIADCRMCCVPAPIVRA